MDYKDRPIEDLDKLSIINEKKLDLSTTKGNNNNSCSLEDVLYSNSFIDFLK